MGYSYLKSWRQRTKQRALDAFGNSCGICGYNRLSSALEFHHIDPSKKDFIISSSSNNNWDGIVCELRKCICVCANCHREIHYNVTKIPDDIRLFDELFSTYDYGNSISYDECKVCGNLKKITYKYCSHVCANKVSEKVDWSLYDLSTLILTDSILSISKTIGVSDNAVRKRLKKLGLPVKQDDIIKYRALV